MDLPRWPLKKQVDHFFDEIKNQLGAVVLVVTSIWAVYALDVVADLTIGFDFRSWFALRPRTLGGLPRIATMPLVHGGFTHLVMNTWGLVFAILALVVLRPRSWLKVLLSVYVVSGVLTWLFGSIGNSAAIVGASGVIMGLVTFLLAPLLFLSGWWCFNKITKQSKQFPLEIQLVPLAVSTVAAIFYLDNLFFGLVPVPAMTMGNHTSWSAHWCGAVAGLLVAFMFLRNDEKVDEYSSVRPDTESLLERPSHEITY